MASIALRPAARMGMVRTAVRQMVRKPPTVNVARNQRGYRSFRFYASTQVELYSNYITKVTRAESPENLEALFKVLQAQGHSVVDPTTKANLHPLLVPLSKGAPVMPSVTEPEDLSTTGDEVYVCLLAWPNPADHPDMSLPVVSMSSGAPSVRLLARSVDEYLHRLLATEDIESEDKPLARAAGDTGQALYEPGTVAGYGMASKLEAYLATKAGMYCDIAEKLVYNHVAKGDQMSSLITGEWYMKGKIPGWARPYEFNAQHMLRCGAAEEARDTARMALRMPWWSLQQGYSSTAEVAAIPGSPEQIFKSLHDEAGVEGPVQQSVAAGRSNAETAMLQAELIMNLMAASGAGNWDDIRGELAEQYKLAGLAPAAELVAGQ